MIVPDEKSGVKRIRCAPQVLGTVRDTLTFVQGILEIELNAATDNPLIFLDEDALSHSYKEDAILMYEPVDQAVSARFGWLYLLADGAGGHAAGEVASRLAVETIAATYYAQAASQHADETMFHAQGKVSHLHGPLGDLETSTMQLKRAFFAAHTRIREAARLKQEYAGMITTCIAAVVKGAHLLIAHVGDSRAYLIRSSSASRPAITRLTTDHSMVTELARLALSPPNRCRARPLAISFCEHWENMSFFADFTYEGSRSIIGPYLAVLGASAAAVGIVAGFGELLGYGLRLVSGRLSDQSGKYWPITIVGYVVQMSSHWPGTGRLRPC